MNRYTAEDWQARAAEDGQAALAVYCCPHHAGTDYMCADLAAEIDAIGDGHLFKARAHGVEGVLDVSTMREATTAEFIRREVPG